MSAVLRADPEHPSDLSKRVTARSKLTQNRWTGLAFPRKPVRKNLNTRSIAITTSFIAELRRRNVLRVGAAYVAVAWLLIQVAQTLFPVFGLGATAVRIVVVVLAIGLLPALIFAWAFELTPEGLKRESEVDRSQSITPQTGKKLDRVIMGVLALALGYFAVDKFVLAPQREQAATEAARAEGRTESLVKSYGEKSIAVLPFVDMSPNKDQEYFSDGISEELLNLLAKIPELRVISRSSAFSFKGKDLEIPEIAKRLNVAHILEGSVRKAGNKVRITAQLIEARSDTHLWSETYDRELDDIFAVQDEIAAAVVEQLKITLLGEAPKAKEVNPEAYALFLQGRQLRRQYTPEGFEQAIALFQQALAIDPNYAAAWEQLAAVYCNQAASGLRPLEEGLRLAREAATKALAIDPDYAPAHAASAGSRWSSTATSRRRHDTSSAPWRWTRPTPTSSAMPPPWPRVWAAWTRPIALDEYVNARDPLNAVGHANLGVAYLCAGRLDDAIASYRTALRLAPDYVGAHYVIGVALLLKGDAPAALDGDAEGTRRDLAPDRAADGLSRARPQGRLRCRARRVDQEVRRRRGLQHRLRSGLAQRARPRVRVARQGGRRQQDPGLSEIAVEPLFANLHDDPRWLPFLRKIGKAPEQLAAIKFDVKVPN